MESRINEIRDKVFSTLIDRSLLGKVDLAQVNMFIDLKHRVEIITAMGRDPHGVWSEEVSRQAMELFQLDGKRLTEI